MKFIIKKDIYEGKILDVWQTVKECADDIGVTHPAILQAIKTGHPCKKYCFERIDIPKEKILHLIQND